MAGTVTVGCKLPNGLHLELGGQRFATLRGTNAAEIVGGHGITRDVDADLFAGWMEQNKDLPMVKNGFIFGSAKTSDVIAEAKEHVDEKTGLEELDPNALPKGLEAATAET